MTDPINIASWFGQVVGALSLCVAIYLTLLHDDTGIPMWYGVVFYVIGAVLLLMNLDPWFGETVVSRARILATLIVFGSELLILDYIRRKYDISYGVIFNG